MTARRCDCCDYQEIHSVNLLHSVRRTGRSWRRRRLHFAVSLCVLIASCYCRFNEKARVLHYFSKHLDLTHRRRLKSNDRQLRNKQRILYVITSMADFDNGRRATVEGYDRFSNTIVPVLRESVNSMVQAGYFVDVYLIAHYNVSASRHDELSTQFSATVGLQVWEDATPIGYASEHSKERVMAHTRGLSRQHRYVIKDKLVHYDIFVCFEDDMLVRGDHVGHFVNVTDTLYSLRLAAEPKLPKTVTLEEAADLFYGPMTKTQLARTIPGFMRVEAALPDFTPAKRNRHDQIPVDFKWNDTAEGGVDPVICCHVSPETANAHIPASPDRDSIYFWETSIEALGVRKMPELDWVLLQGGNNNEKWTDPTFVVGDYWSGRGDVAYFGDRSRPDRKLGRYMNNQGGWMATKRQIFEWHVWWCRSGLLP